MLNFACLIRGGALIPLCPLRFSRTRPGFAGLNQLLQSDPSALNFGSMTPRAGAVAAADFWGASNMVAMSVASLSGDAAGTFDDGCITVVTDV